MCDSKLLRFPVTWVIRFFRFSHFDVSVNMYDYVKRIGLDPRCYGLFSYLMIYLPCHWAQTTGYHLTAIKIGLYHIYPSTVNRSNFGRIWDVCIFFWLCQWIKVFLTSATLAYVSYPGRGFLSKSICWTSFLVKKFDHKLYYNCNKNPLENERVDQKIRPFMQAWRNEMKKRVYVQGFFDVSNSGMCITSWPGRFVSSDLLFIFFWCKNLLITWIIFFKKPIEKWVSWSKTTTFYT